MIATPAYFSCIGSEKEKVLPLPTSLCTQIAPPCSSTICLLMANPKPNPGIPDLSEEG